MARVLILQACAMTRMIVPGTINSLLRSCPQFALAIRGDTRKHHTQYTNPSQKSQFCSLRSPKKKTHPKPFLLPLVLHTWILLQDPLGKENASPGASERGTSCSLQVGAGGPKLMAKRGIYRGFNLIYKAIYRAYTYLKGHL